VSLTNGLRRAETVTRTCAHHDYGAAIEGAQHPVPSPPHVAHDACGAPPDKVCPLRMIRDHDRSPLMDGFFLSKDNPITQLEPRAQELTPRGCDQCPDLKWAEPLLTK
jgi:hypothetical protein